MNKNTSDRSAARTSLVSKFVKLLASGARHRDALTQAGVEWGDISRQLATPECRPKYAAAMESRKKVWARRKTILSGPCGCLAAGQKKSWGRTMNSKRQTTKCSRKKATDKSAQNTTPSGISIKQERAIAAILEGRTIEAAMKKARLARSTFYEWLKDDRFREELNARRKYLFESALDDLKALLGDSVNEPQRLILYKDPKIRLGAVRTSIDAALRADEQLNFLDRLEKLEAENN